MESKVSGHWTDERLIAHSYGVETADGHFQSCAECQARLAGMQANRRAVESVSPDEVSFEFLAGQRRKIYARLTERQAWWSQVQLRRWASAAMAVLVLSGGLLFFEQSQQPQPTDKVSDVQLAQQLSSITEDSEPPSTAPLQALFEN